MPEHEELECKLTGSQLMEELRHYPWLQAVPLWPAVAFAATVLQLMIKLYDAWEHAEYRLVN